MKEFNSLDDILDFAINEEQMAADFYTALAEKMPHQDMKDTFEQFALEELGHRLKLEAIKSADIVNILKPNTAIVDAPSINTQAYSDYLKSFLTDKSVKLICEHKADLNYPSASAASILAKVTRGRTSVTKSGGF